MSRILFTQIDLFNYLQVTIAGLRRLFHELERYTINLIEYCPLLLPFRPMVDRYGSLLQESGSMSHYDQFPTRPEHASKLFHLNRRDLLKTVASYAVLPAFPIAPTKNASMPLDPAQFFFADGLPQAYPETWSDDVVRYIWSDNPGNSNTLFLRSVFTLPAEPVRGILSILNDARFGLWVNGEEVRPLAQAASWRLNSSYDITRLLQRGQNVLCIQSMGLNTDYHSQPLTPLCGVAAQLEMSVDNRLEVLQTDGRWRVAHGVLGNSWLKPEEPGGMWATATIVRAANQAPWVNLKNWPYPLPDPSSHQLRVLPVAPAKILSLQEGIPAHTLESSRRIDLGVDRSKTALWYASSSLQTDARLELARKELPGVIVDFGKELAGRLHIRSASDEPVALLVSLGESPGEMWNGPHLGVLDLFLPAHGVTITPITGFRYAAIHAITLMPDKAGVAQLSLVEIRCDMVHEPVRYQGTCTSSDKLIEQLWAVGAYTTHLCLQRELWDAPKRDRNAYGGDLHPVTPILNEVFGNSEPVYRTLDLLSSGVWSPGKPVLRHVNGISGYSAAWVHVLADTFLHTGNQMELTLRLPFLIELLLYMEDDLDAKSLFANLRRQWCFVDWAIGLDGANAKDAPNSTAGPSEAVVATHFFFLSAFRHAATLLGTSTQHEATTLSGHYAQLADRMQAAARRHWWNKDTRSFGNRIQPNAMAVYAGAVDGADAQHIADSILLAPLQPVSGPLDWSSDTQIVSPYYQFYVLEALALAGRTQEAAASMKSYYGGMLDRGATTFWERFDPRIIAGPSIPGFGPDWFAGPYHGASMYHESSCHGWSSAPTSWITRHIVGLSTIVPGCGKIRIAPDLCNLNWIDGSMATPHGVIRARHSYMGGRWRTRKELPPGVEADVSLPGMEKEHVRIYVNGVKAKAEKDDQGRHFLRIARAGRTIIEIN